MSEKSQTKELDPVTKAEIKAVLGIATFVITTFLKDRLAVNIYCELINVLTMIETFIDQN